LYVERRIDRTAMEAKINHLSEVVTQVQSSIKSALVGWVEIKEWQKRCRITPDCTVNLLKPLESQFPWRIGDDDSDGVVRGEATVDISQCDHNLRLLGQHINHQDLGQETFQEDKYLSSDDKTSDDESYCSEDDGFCGFSAGTFSNTNHCIVPFRAIRYSKSRHPFGAIASAEENLEKLIIVYLPTRSRDYNGDGDDDVDDDDDDDDNDSDDSAALVRCIRRGDDDGGAGCGGDDGGVGGDDGGGGGNLLLSGWAPERDLPARPAKNALRFISFQIGDFSHTVTPVVVDSVIRIAIVFKVYRGSSVHDYWLKIARVETSLLSAVSSMPGRNNVLFAHPNLRLIAGILERSKLEFIRVYWPMKTAAGSESRFAFRNIHNTLPKKSDIGCSFYGDLVHLETKAYRIEHMVKLGNPKQNRIRYKFSAFDDPCTRYKVRHVRFNVGLLVNPLPETEACLRPECPEPCIADGKHYCTWMRYM
jgi:hypothetical protein